MIMSLPDPEEAAAFVRKGLITVGATISDIQSNLLESSEEPDETQLQSMSKLEQINQEILEEQDRKSLVRDSEEACLKHIVGHLLDFLQQCPSATYEEWISQLHPENVLDDPKKIVIDHRFYVSDSDHRKVWNENLGIGTGRKYVSARYRLVPEHKS